MLCLLSFLNPEAQAVTENPRVQCDIPYTTCQLCALAA